MVLDLVDLADTSILAGAPSGRQLYAKLIEALPTEPVMPEPFFLDFKRVEVATASFLRESVLAFRTFVRGRKSNFYPAIANANAQVIDEFVELTYARGDIVMVCTIAEDGQILRCQPVGKLDPMQQVTFDLVNKIGETTTNRIMKAEDSNIKSTAWNNRLSSLCSLGLISEQSQGRTKVYKPFFKG